MVSFSSNAAAATRTPCFRYKLWGRAPINWFTKVIIVCIFWCFAIYSILANLTYVREERTELLVQERTQSKILCYVLLSRGSLGAGKTIQATWGSKCDFIVFYGRFNYSTDSDSSNSINVTYINAKEGYPYLWNKTKAALLHLYHNYGESYDWFIKADDDTFVIVENLRRFVQRFDPKEPVWTGFKLRSAHTKLPYMSGGAGYLFSREALKRVAEILKPLNSSSLGAPKPIDANRNTCNVHSDIGYEDLELGKCFHTAGVQEITSVDSKGRQRFLPLPLQQLLNDEISSFHWLRYQSWDTLKFGKRCCSPTLITIHKMSSSEMNALYFLLYNLKTDLAE